MEPRRSAQPVAHPAPIINSGGTGGNSILNTVLVVLLIIMSVVVTAYLVTLLVKSSGAKPAIKSKQTQALFLTNGQVYFGKLANIDSSYVKLTDIYYLQVQQQVQPGQKADSQQPQVSLAKLGGELHGPEDVMYVSREQVLFWENLKEDGKVAQAIKDYKAKK
ncbi:MAG TPA: hypothetical protein VMR98_00490 [Candidatus Polarisedimenticolaceae bacterium]|nr:hypothetical protein [Candidatus Polarisedimenticolaceae bacterium]